MMLPRRWTKNTFVPYSTATPLPERFIRHALGPDTDQQWVTLTIVFNLTILPITIIALNDLMGLLGIFLPLLIAWSVIIMTIISTAVLGAVTTGEERRSPHFEMIYLTSVSDFALGHSFLFATLYRMRVWIVLSITMVPTIIIGMIAVGAWTIERCEPLLNLDQCDPFYGTELSPLSSLLLGMFICIGIAGLLPLAAVTGVGLALRGRHPVYAAATTMVGTVFALGLTILLSTAFLIPPPTQVSLWNGMLFLEVLILAVIAMLIWASSKQQYQGQEFLFILLALLAMIFVVGLTQANARVRLSVISLAMIGVLPYGLLLIATHYFWRAARRTTD
jgi:hypothetical protein